MYSMHTFYNPEYDNIRYEILNSQKPLAVCDLKQNLKIKYQLDARDLVGKQDPNECFTCKLCTYIV